MGGVGAWMPGVEMCVEMEDCDGLVVNLLQCPEGRQGDRMVSSKSDQFWMDVAFGVGIAEWLAGQEFHVRRGHLMQGEGRDAVPHMADLVAKTIEPHFVEEETLMRDRKSVV